jgi:hypothetical protein
MDAIWQAINQTLRIDELTEINKIWETVGNITSVEAFAIWLLASKAGRERN